MKTGKKEFKITSSDEQMQADPILRNGTTGTSLAITEKEKTSLMPLTDPEKYKEMVTQAMPEFVKYVDTKEDAGNAMMASAQEMMLAVVDVLSRYFEFTEADIKTFNKHLTDILQGIEQIEDGGLSMLSLHSVGRVGDIIQQVGVDALLKKIAETRYQKERLWRTGLDVPNQIEGSKLEKQLQKSRN